MTKKNAIYPTARFTIKRELAEPVYRNRQLFHGMTEVHMHAWELEHVSLFWEMLGAGLAGGKPEIKMNLSEEAMNDISLYLLIAADLLNQSGDPALSDWVRNLAGIIESTWFDKWGYRYGEI